MNFSESGGAVCVLPDDLLHPVKMLSAEITSKRELNPAGVRQVAMTVLRITRAGITQKIGVDIRSYLRL
jgi:hypothetical protein